MDSLNNNDIILRITPYLNAHELLNLALTCKRFGGLRDDTKRNSSDDNGNHYTWSFMEEVARQIISNAKEEERNALPKYDGETWLAVYKELELLRRPLTFDQLLGGDEHNICYVEGDKSCVRSIESMWKTAVSNNIMRGGKHFVTFRKTGRGGLCVGIIRPVRGLEERFRSKPCSPLHAKNWPALRVQRNARWGTKTNQINCCMYKSFNGRCGWSDWQTASDDINRGNWVGQELLPVGECDVGMVLDLDEGTLSVYVDGRRLGIMKHVSSSHSCVPILFIQLKIFSIYVRLFNRVYLVNIVGWHLMAGILQVRVLFRSREEAFQKCQKRGPEKSERNRGPFGISITTTNWTINITSS